MLYITYKENMILYVTLHARKVTIEERRQFETNMGPCIFFLCYFNSSNCWSLVLTCFSQRHCNAFCRSFAADKHHARLRPLHNHTACTSLRPGEEAAETIWHAVNRPVNIVLMCWNTIFFDSPEILRQYFTGNRKLSCILATISNWFPNKKI